MLRSHLIQGLKRLQCPKWKRIRDLPFEAQCYGLNSIWPKCNGHGCCKCGCSCWKVKGFGLPQREAKEPLHVKESLKLSSSFCPAKQAVSVKGSRASCQPPSLCFLLLYTFATLSDFKTKGLAFLVKEGGQDCETWGMSNLWLSGV